MKRKRGKAAATGLGLLLAASPATAIAPTNADKIPEDAFHPVIRDFPIDQKPPPKRPKPPTKQKMIVKEIAPPDPPQSADGPTVADAKAYALSVLGPTQYACLDKIVEHESGWDPYDTNPTSGAYGLPQALPGSKMAWAGNDWRTNPVTQLKWMIHYVNQRYGSACAAWDYWQRNRWY